MYHTLVLWLIPMTFYVRGLSISYRGQSNGRSLQSIGSTADFAIWSTVEVGVGIVAACTATLRPLFQAITSRTDHSSYAYGASASGRQGNRQRAGYQRSINLDELGSDTATFTTVSHERLKAPDKTHGRGVSDGQITCIEYHDR